MPVCGIREWNRRHPFASINLFSAILLSFTSEFYFVIEPQKLRAFVQSSVASNLQKGLFLS